jgi:hypothetical protein
LVGSLEIIADGCQIKIGVTRKGEKNAKKMWMAVFALTLLTALGGLSMAEKETDDNPCNDAKYLELQGKDINALSSREYDLFKSKDEACNQYKQSSRTVELMKKSEKHSNTWLWITAGITIIPLIIFGL